MYPFPSVNMAKYPWNSRLPPAQACCFPLESSTWGRGVHQNTQSFVLAHGKHPAPATARPSHPQTQFQFTLLEGRQRDREKDG